MPVSILGCHPTMGSLFVWFIFSVNPRGVRSKSISRNSMPMYGGILRHLIVHGDLNQHQLIVQAFKSPPTSTSSSSSKASAGAGNCPFVKIMSRDCPLGAPVSHVRVRFCVTRAAWTCSDRAKRPTAESRDEREYISKMTPSLRTSEV